MNRVGALPGSCTALSGDFVDKLGVLPYPHPLACAVGQIWGLGRASADTRAFRPSPERGGPGGGGWRQAGRGCHSGSHISMTIIYNAII